MEEGESGADSKLTERLQKLRQWQEEQRTRLLEQQRQQYESLRQEQEKIHHMLTLQKVMTNMEIVPIGVSNIESSPRPPSSLSDSPRSPNLLTTSPIVMGHLSPSERIERAAQLRQLLQEARIEQALITPTIDQSGNHAPSEDSDTAAFEVDGVCPLPDTSFECHDSEPENKAVTCTNQEDIPKRSVQENIPKRHLAPRMAKMYSGVPAVPENGKKKTTDTPKQVAVAYDERPIQPGLGSQVKNFEEFVEMKLQTCDSVCEDHTNAKGDMPPSPPLEVKHRFLRKGEGLMRFSLQGSERSPSNDSVGSAGKRVKPRSAKKKFPETKTAFHYHLKPRLMFPEKKKNVNRKITSSKRMPMRDIRGKNIHARHIGLSKGGNNSVNVTSEKTEVTNNMLSSIYQPLQQNRVTKIKSFSPGHLEHFSQDAIGYTQREKLTEFQRNLCALAAINSGDQNSTPEAIVRRLKNLNLKWNDDTTRDHLLSSPERSFLLRVEELEEKKKKENEELVEFEILERAAEETSFCSTSSIVVRALQWRTVQMSPRGSPRRSIPRLSLVSEQMDEDPTTDDFAQANSRLSFAEDEVCLKNAIQACVNYGETSPQPDTTTEQSTAEDVSDTPTNNILVTHAAPIDEGPVEMAAETNSSTEVNRDEQKVPVTQHKMPCDELSSIQEETTDMSSLEVSLDPDATLHRSSSSEGFEFLDNESWVDNDEETLSGTTSPLQQAKRSPSRGHHQSPASAFVARYFPVLQRKMSKVKEKVSSPKSSPPTSMNENVTLINPAVLWEKMNQLEQEVERFRSLSSTLEELNQQHKHAVEKLKKDSAEFDKYKNMEMLKLENSLEEEKKKLRRERQLCDQFLKARAQAERRDKDEIQSLKKQVEDLRSDLKRKESRWSSTNSRLQERLRSVETENAELRREVQELAKQRLQNWQRSKKKPSVSSAKFGSPPFADTIPSSSSPTATPVVNGHVSPPLCPGNISQLSPPEKDLSALIEAKAAKPAAVDNDKKLPTDSGQNMGQLRPIGALRPGTDNNEERTENPYQFDPGTSLVDKDDKSVDEIRHKDGTIERVYGNGTHKIFYPNGTRKEISSDGQSVMVFFFNGDVKHTLPDGRCIYYFAANKTTHTTYPDGLQVYHFRNNQLEKHYPDGTKEIVFANQSIKLLFPDGSEETNLVDGTIIRSVPDGNRIVQFPNGQKEIHTKEYKKREYPDGTVKYLFADGRQETRYSNGRVRIKDKDGNLTLDSKYPDPSHLRK